MKKKRTGKLKTCRVAARLEISTDSCASVESLFARNNLGASTTYEDALENQLANCLLSADVELLKIHLFLGRLLVECIYDLLI